jgi:predicted DNA binding CopG/RHH family protein
MSKSTRINLAIPVEVAIQIEKECEKRGIAKTQYIKEAINERIKNGFNHKTEETINILHQDLKDIKNIMSLVLSRLEKAE